MSNLLDDIPKEDENNKKKDKKKKSNTEAKIDINANISIYDKADSDESFEKPKKKKNSKIKEDISQDKSPNNMFDDVLDLVKQKNTSKF